MSSTSSLFPHGLKQTRLPALLPSPAAMPSSSSIPSSVDSNQAVRAVIHGYDSVIPVIRYLLWQLEEAKTDEERIEGTIKLFQFINKNHTFLVYESELRSIIVAKMASIEANIKKSANRFAAANYDEALDMLRTSIWANVRHYKMRSIIDKHLGEIRSTLGEYEKWGRSESLINEFNTTKGLLDTIKYHPDYVA